MSGIISLDWKREWLSLSGEGKGILMIAATTVVLHYSVCQARVIAYLLLTQIQGQLLKLHRPEQSVFMPGELTLDHIHG